MLCPLHMLPASSRGRQAPCPSALNPRVVLESCRPAEHMTALRASCIMLSYSDRPKLNKGSLVLCCLTFNPQLLPGLLFLRTPRALALRTMSFPCSAPRSASSKDAHSCVVSCADTALTKTRRSSCTDACPCCHRLMLSFGAAAVVARYRSPSPLLLQLSGKNLSNRDAHA